MKIDQMTKQQVVLLCLLICLVTSIATASAMLSLTSQTQQPVIQTVNRIIEKTVETIVPTTTKEPVKEVETVIIREDDAVVSAVEKNRNSIVRLFSVERRNRHLSNAIVVSNDGKILSIFINNEEVEVVLPDGQKVTAYQINQIENLLSVWQIKDYSLSLTPVTFNTEKIKIGQNLIAIGGDTQDSVSTGILASLTEGEIFSQFTVSNTIDSSTLGSVVFDMFGKLDGIKIDKNNYVLVKNLASYLTPVVTDIPNDEVGNNIATTTDLEIGTSTEDLATTSTSTATTTNE